MYFHFQVFDGAGLSFLGGTLNCGARKNKSVGGVLVGKQELLVQVGLANLICSGPSLLCLPVELNIPFELGLGRLTTILIMPNMLAQDTASFLQTEL